MRRRARRSGRPDILQPLEASPKAFTAIIDLDLLNILEYDSARLERSKIDWDLEIGRLVGNVEIESDQGVRLVRGA